MEKELDKIILSLKETIKLTKLVVTDDKVLENAIKIFISNNINESKKGFFGGNIPVKKEEGLKNEQEQDLSKPTDKQIYFLKQNNKIVPKTRIEATKLIERLKGGLKEK